MATFKGKRLTVEIYGTSHGATVGARVTGFPAFRCDPTALTRFTSRRKANLSAYSTARL